MSPAWEETTWPVLGRRVFGPGLGHPEQVGAAAAHLSGFFRLPETKMKSDFPLSFQTSHIVPSPSLARGQAASLRVISLRYRCHHLTVSFFPSYNVSQHSSEQLSRLQTSPMDLISPGSTDVWESAR